MASTAATNLRRIANEAKSFPRKFVEGGVKDVRVPIQKGLKADTGGDSILSGTNRQGRAGKLTVQARVKGDAIVTGTVKPGPSGRPVAIWHWLEYGTGPPGPTAGKRTWSRAAAPAVEKLQRSAKRAFSSIMEG
jgi:hypothetical protein